LYKHEKRLARPLLVAAMALFYLGCAFAYFLVLPAAFRFLVAVTPNGVEMMTDISQYLDFVMLMFFAFGLCFEVPVAVVVLAAIGVVDLDKLRGGRRYAIVGAFGVAAVITPPDITSMLMLGIPMCLLYEVGVLAVRWLIQPRSLKPDAG
jgi:sec-independent protein translocase protein TatC